MLMFRYLLLYLFASVGIATLQADDAVAPQSDEKAKTAAPAEK
ncbi:MAG: hypothetical protein QOJ36_359, partial [Verrucomicrobiota bacterium]